MTGGQEVQLRETIYAYGTLGKGDLITRKPVLRKTRRENNISDIFMVAKEFKFLPCGL